LNRRQQRKRRGGQFEFPSVVSVFSCSKNFAKNAKFPGIALQRRSAESRNQRNATTDFTDGTDKREGLPIREIREIRGKNLPENEWFYSIVIQQDRTLTLRESISPHTA
jgi:hypothetical protein